MTEPHITRPDTSKRYTPACNLTCKGTDRPVWETPAKGYRTPDGVKHLVCQCCMQELRLLTGLEAGIADAPNIDPSIDQTGRRRFFCDRCGYDIVLLKDLHVKES